MSKLYVRVDGVWVRVYRLDTWRVWVAYSLGVAAIVGLLATVGIWL